MTQKVQSRHNSAATRVRPTALLVLGMHRSGTSAITRICSLLGAELGANLLPPAPDNAAGFWEQSEIKDIHDELLAALKSSWDDFRPLPQHWEETPAAQTARKQIRAIIERDFATTPLWVVKDPRLCRLLPMWLTLLEELECEPRFLLVARNPLEVAASLQKRDGFLPAKSIALWLRHMLDAERETRQHRRAILTYDHVLANWRGSMNHVGRTLEIDWHTQIDNQAGAVDAFLSTDLRHLSVADETLAVDPLVSGWARDAYLAYQSLAYDEGRTGNPAATLDRVDAELQRADQLFGVWLATQEQQQGARYREQLQQAEQAFGVRLATQAQQRAVLHEGQLRELTGRAEQLQQEVATQQTTLAARDVELAARARDIEQRSQEIARRDQELAQHKQEIAQRNQEIVRRDEEIRQRDRELSRRDQLIQVQREELAAARREQALRTAQVEQLTEELSFKSGQIEELTRERKEMQVKAAAQQSQIDQMARDAAAKVTEYETRLAALKTEVESLQKRLETVLGEHGTRGRRIEELGDLLYRARREQGTLRAVARRIRRVTKFMHYVDSPVGQRIAVSEFSMMGWCFEIGSARPVQSIRARVGKKTFRGACGKSRPDVAEVHAGQASTDTLKLSGFQIDVALRSGEHEIVLEATDARGRWRVFGKHRLMVLPGGISPAQLTGTEPSTVELEEQRQQARELSYQPLISVITAVYNTPAQVLREMIQSVLAQTYDKWELCLADGNSDTPGVREILKEFERSDRRVRVVFLDCNQGIAGNTNAALHLARGEFIALLDHDDTLVPFALFEVVKALNANPQLDMIYSDEDKVDGEGNRYEPFFKPDWSPDLLFSFMYTGHLTVYRKKLVDDLGGFRSEYDFSQDYDLALRVVERTNAIAHIQKILYHWRSIPGSAAAGDKPYARVSNLAALAQSAKRRGYGSQVMEYPYANRIKYAILGRPLVSIIIPTDGESTISVCLERLLQQTGYAHFEVVVVTNSALLRQLQPRYDGESKIRFVPFDQLFNFSAKCNLGASVATGQYLLFLNDDVEPLKDDWLENMLEVFQRPEVGAVSPKLLYADGRIQHAGLVTGVRGLAGTAFHCEAADYSGYFNMAISMRNTSALSAACMLVSRKAFEQVDGFDAVNTPIMNSDLDLSFRLRENGFLLVYTPFATLRHIGHASLGKVNREPHTPDKADIYLLKRWGGYTATDPYYTENMRDMLYKDSPTKYRMSAVNRCGVDKTRGDILLVTHDLSISGAPITMSRLAVFLRDAGYFVTVVSPEDGALLSYYEQHGIPVVIDPLILQVPSAVTTLLKNFDVILASTILGVQVVHTARSIRKPCVWFVQESQFGVQMATRDVSVSDALGLADVVVFPSDHTRQLYQRFCRANAHLTLYHGLSLPSEAPRPALAKDERKLIVVHAGSMEPRKGQDLLLKSIAALPPEIAETCEFYFLGRILDHKFFAELQQAAQGWHQVHFLGETSHEEALAYIQAADVFVCSSRDECLPLSIQEAMAYSKAIVSADVGAVPEMIQHEVHGLIVPVGDPDAMAQALARLWKDRSLRERLGKNARARFQQQDLTMERFGRDIDDLIAKLTTPVGQAQAVL